MKKHESSVTIRSEFGTRRFVFNAKAMSELKAEALSSNKCEFSLVELMIGLIWRSSQELYMVS